MKKVQKAMREFEKIKSQLQHTASVVSHTKDSKLWDHEAIVRKKIKALKGMDARQFSDYDDTMLGYRALLDDISGRLLRHYNKKRGTSYQFEEIVGSDMDGYVSSGIMSVLVTSHIPKLIAEDFKIHFPENPKDEFDKARRMKRRFILHLGETNTGKTYTAIERLKQVENGVYLAPLRILALENFERLNKDGVACNLLTGEEEITVDNARHVCSTIEKLDIDREYAVAVIDEVQMIGNAQRGQAWTRALLGLRCPEIHLCGASNAKLLLEQIIQDCGDDYDIIDYKRNTPLEVSAVPFELGKIEKGDALVAFSKRRVLELSKHFQDKRIKNSVIYGNLPPEVRRMQYHAFINGTSQILITTDAIGMGVNLPIRRIVFMDLMKFDGEEKRYISSQEVKQIAGRAGRKGIYDVGYVCSSRDDPDFIRENLEVEDDPIRQAVLGPGEALVKIRGLPLREKLALWSTSDERLDYYKKMDVRDYLLVLESIKPFRLTDETAFKLMKVPFDGRDTELLQTFLEYVDACFVKNQGELRRPIPAGGRLHELEKYYQKLGLYYSFSKNFALEFEPEWVYQERVHTSERINKWLLRL